MLRHASIHARRHARPSILPRVSAVAVPNHVVHTKRSFYAAPLYKFAKSVMPRMSDTEKAALESGTIGFDREIFNGTPQLSSLAKYSAVLSPEEQSFMDHEVQQLCELLDDYTIVRDQDLPPEVWTFIKENKFLGMIIPKKYGGLEMSAHGHSMVITKLSTRSASAAVTVCVPNSLGPAELLLRYGTEDQKNEYLPKLALGQHVPCFGLTGPSSGSDAANMRDEGIVCKDPETGEIGIKAHFNKRYITLAPVASCVGLAIKVTDPDNLLNGTGHEGITVVLLERNHANLNMGDRHDPLSSAFMNGTVTGKDVFIPLNKVIGGQERVGFGWNMLMDCLAEGRSISLPASAVAASKVTLNAVGGYARIRKQFKVPIATMEGVQEHLARIASTTFMITSGQFLVNAMINQHEQPAVLSGVCKQQITERGRQVVIDGMDVLGGAGICKGPSNFLANAFTSMPIAVTVEGANTLTRSLIIFGQGLTRAHPHLYDMIKTIQAGDQPNEFKTQLHQLVGHALRNTASSVTCAVTRQRTGASTDPLAYYESQFAKLSTNFALCSDLALTLGGKLKFTEMVSGRFADIFSNLYLGYACMWYYQANQDTTPGLDVMLDYTLNQLCVETQESFEGLFNNFPLWGVGPVMRRLTFPFGLPYVANADVHSKAVADLITTDSPTRELLSRSVFLSTENPHDRVALIHRTLRLAVEADEILNDARKAKRSLTLEEQLLVDQVETAREEIIQVDVFAKLGKERLESSEYVRPALADYQAGLK